MIISQWRGLVARTGLKVTIKEHTGAGVVALAIVVAAIFDGAFSASAFAILSAVVWAAVLAGVFGRALPTGPVAVPAVVGGALFASVVVLAMASMAWAPDQGRAFEEAVRISAYLGMFVLAACSAGPGGRRQWLGGLTLGLGLVAVLSVFSYLEPGVLNPEDIGEIVPNAAGRLSYPLGYWNALAALLACASVLLADAAVRSAQRPSRVVALVALPIALLGLWLTDSRGGVAAAAVGLLILLAVSRERGRVAPVLLLALTGAAVLVVSAELCDELLAGDDTDTARAQGHGLGLLVLAVTLAWGAMAWRLDGAKLRSASPSRRSKLALIVILIAAVAAGVVAADPAERFSEFKETPPALVSGAGVSREANSSGRWQFWSEALAAFEEQPTRGIGAGSYESWWGRYASIPLFVRNPHSLPMQQLAELGLVGALLMLGFLVAFANAALRHLRARELQPDTGVMIGVVVAGSLAAAVDWNWQFPASFGCVIVAAALLMASAPGRSLNLRAPGAIVIALLGIASVLAAGSVALTELRLEQSRTAAAEGRFETSFERARQAQDLQPFASKPLVQLALLEEREKDYGQALGYLAEATDRDEEDWRLANLELDLRLFARDAAGTRAALRRLRRYLPVPLALRE
jgi:O-Antigen ligase